MIFFNGIRNLQDYLELFCLKMVKVEIMEMSGNYEKY